MSRSFMGANMSVSAEPGQARLQVHTGVAGPIMKALETHNYSDWGWFSTAKWEKPTGVVE